MSDRIFYGRKSRVMWKAIPVKILRKDVNKKLLFLMIVSGANVGDKLPWSESNTRRRAKLSLSKHTLNNSVALTRRNWQAFSRKNRAQWPYIEAAVSREKPQRWRHSPESLTYLRQWRETGFLCAPPTVSAENSWVSSTLKCPLLSPKIKLQSRML